MTREITNKLIDCAEVGCLAWEELARACLMYMSEDDVKDMAECNCFDGFWEDDDEEEDEDEGDEV